VTAGDVTAAEVTSLDEGPFATARKVADAVIYEGYVLYPYRASAQKNQVRWQFGVLAPRPYSETTGSEAWAMQTECVLEASVLALVQVQVRFLRVRSRLVEQAPRDEGDEFIPVASLDVDGQLWTTWDESTEHQIDLSPIALRHLVGAGPTPDPAASETAIALEGCLEQEQLQDTSGRIVGRVVRELRPVAGRIEVTASSFEAPSGLTRLRVRVENLTSWPGHRGVKRDETVRNSLVAVHVLAAVDDGRFLSSFDPPDHARGAVASCTNMGSFPVLIGEEGGDNVILASPIILYDHPEVAPESQGDMFDATEIDEILALRILTLTDEEKREARGTDDLAASIIDRCDAMPPEMFERLHGAVRALRSVPEPAAKEPAAQDAAVPWWDPEMDASVDPAHDTILLGAVEVGKGAKVRLNPTRRADAQDIFLAGRSAVVAGIFHDVDGDVHLSVVLDDDPASEFHEWYGRYLYFHPEEVEVLEAAL
jgi:hypothetical protein